MFSTKSAFPDKKNEGSITTNDECGGRSQFLTEANTYQVLLANSRGNRNKRESNIPRDKIDFNRWLTH